MTAIPDAGRRSPMIFSHAFSQAEDPLRTKGWRHTDTLQTDVKVELINGLYTAHGTQTNAGTNGSNFDDSAVFLDGFSPNHYIEGYVNRDPAISGSAPPNLEIELLLGWSDDNPLRSTGFGDTHSDGWEINIHHLGEYLQVGRFKGINLVDLRSGVPVPATGDIFGASLFWLSDTAVRVRVYYNSITPIIDVIDNNGTMPKHGNPGIGMYRSLNGANDKLGFYAVNARSF